MSMRDISLLTFSKDVIGTKYSPNIHKVIMHIYKLGKS